MPTVKVTARGVAAHAGNHHKEGANAIWALSRFIMRVSQKAPEARFSELSGGQSRNTVPDHAEVLLTASDNVINALELDSDIDRTSLSLERVS